MRAIGSQHAVVRLSVRVKAKERQIEKPVDVWTRSTDTKRVRFVRARETRVVAGQTTVRVTGVEEIVTGETLVESQLHRVVQTFRERRRRQSRSKRLRNQTHTRIRNEEVLVARRVDETNVLDRAVEILARVTTAEYERRRQTILGTNGEFSLSRRFQIRIDTIV